MKIETKEILRGLLDEAKVDKVSYKDETKELKKLSNEISKVVRKLQKKVEKDIKLYTGMNSEEFDTYNITYNLELINDDYIGQMDYGIDRIEDAISRVPDVEKAANNMLKMLKK